MLGHPEDSVGKTVSIVVHQDGDIRKWSGRCLGSRPVRKKSVELGVSGEKTGKDALVTFVILRSRAACLYSK